jgi:protein TonB
MTVYATVMKKSDSKYPGITGERKYLKRSRIRIGPVVFMMLTCVTGVFLLVPITQMISGFGRTAPEMLSIDVALPPPPPPPPDIDQPDPPPDEPPPPEMQPPPQQLSLSQMDVALNLGFGDAMAGAFSFDGFGVSAQDTAEDLQIFDISDLDSAPRMLRPGQFVYPPEMRRARVQGLVRLMVIIDERGNVRVENVIESRIRDFNEAAIRFAESSVFETPMVNGKAVRARYAFPVRFAL